MLILPPLHNVGESVNTFYVHSLKSQCTSNMRTFLSTATAFASCLVVSTQDAPATTPDNLVKYTIFAEGINASFIGYGARSTDIYVKDKDGFFQDIVLGYDDGAGYINNTNNEHTYFGATGMFWEKSLRL